MSKNKYLTEIRTFTITLLNFYNITYNFTQLNFFYKPIFYNIFFEIYICIIIYKYEDNLKKNKSILNMS